MFDVEQKVVCINDAWQPWVYDTYNELPKKGNIYTVRETDIGRDDLGSVQQDGSNIVFIVWLEELKNDDEITPSGKNLGEMGFRSDRFAPLETIEEEQVERGMIIKIEDKPLVLIGKN